MFFDNKSNNNPYKKLKEQGIAPDSSMQDIKKSILNSLGKKVDDDTRMAFEEIRLIKRRLCVDFFLYQIDGNIVSLNLLDKHIKSSINDLKKPDLTDFLTPDLSPLYEMEKDFRKLSPDKKEITQLKILDDEDWLIDMVCFDE